MEAATRGRNRNRQKAMGAGIGICRRQQEVGTGIGRLLDVRTYNKRTSLEQVKQLRRV